MIADLDILRGLAVALGLGLLVGVERERRRDDAGHAVAGVRTFALIGLAGHPREQGAGVTVTRYWKAGSVDYKKVPQLQGVDLEPFRKKGGEEVRVSVHPN